MIMMMMIILSKIQTTTTEKKLRTNLFFIALFAIGEKNKIHIFNNVQPSCFCFGICVILIGFDIFKQ